MRLLTSCLVGLLLSGCATNMVNQQAERVRYAQDVGSVTVAEVSVIPWSEAAPILQPNFPISSASALNLAMPTTQALDERFASLMRASLSAGLPTRSSTRTVTRTGAPGAMETEISQVDTRKTGTDVIVDDPTIIPGNAASLPGFPGERALPAGSDPLLQHLAATAVFQEINLINRYVSQRVDFEGYEAFLVRLQLSVMPSRRNMPYDASSEITFHGRDVAKLTGYSPDKFEYEYQANGKPSAVIQPPADSCRDSGHIRVLPMVVTDNLEGLAASRSSDIANQLGIALLATAGNVGLGGDFGLTREALTSALGRDLNSLFSVSRVADNTIRVSLGASLRPGAEPALIKRSHNLSVIILIKPCGWSQQQIITAVAKTSFSDVKSGQTLEPRSYREIATQIKSKIDGKYLFSNLHTADYFELYHLAALQDFESFRRKLVQYRYLSHSCRLENKSDLRNSADRRHGNRRGLDAISPALEEAGSVDMAKSCPEILQIANLVVPGLWSDLIGSRPTGEFSYASIPLQIGKQPVFAAPAANQIVIVTPSETELAAKLVGGTIPKANRPALAALYLDDTSFVNATSVDVTGPVTTFKFPKPPKFDPKTATAKLVVDYPKSAADPQQVSFANVQIVQKDEQPAADNIFKIDAGSTLIVAAAEGSGSMNIIVSGGKADTKPVKLAISGADVVSATTLRGAAMDASAGVFTIKGNGETQFNLRNLYPAQPVRVQLLDDKDKSVGPPIVRPVYWSAAMPKP